MRIALAAIGALGVLALTGAAHGDVRDLEWGTCIDAGVTHSPENSAAACTEIIQDGTESTATIAIAYVYRGQSLLRGGRVQLALNDFDQAIRLDIHSAPAYRGRAKAYEAMANYARAIRDFDQAGTLDQRNEATFAGRCRARAEVNRDLGVARAACNAGLAMAPADPELLAARGLVDLRQGRLLEAQRDFDAAIEADDTLAAAHYGRGLAASRAGHDGGADLARATQLDSSLAQRYATLDLAAAAAAQSDQIVVIGRPDSAVRNFVTQMAVAPRDSQLARWDRSFCPSLAGLEQPYAQQVLDRISQRAIALGLEIGQPGCPPMR